MESTMSIELPSKETQGLRKHVAELAAHNADLQDALDQLKGGPAGTPVASLIFSLAQAISTANQALDRNGQPGQPRFVVSGAEASIPAYFEWRDGRLLATLVAPTSAAGDANRIGVMRLSLGQIPAASAK